MAHPQVFWSDLTAITATHCMLIAKCKTAVTPVLMHWSYCSLAHTPVLMHWSYCSLALSHRCDFPMIFLMNTTSSLLLPYVASLSLVSRQQPLIQLINMNTSNSRVRMILPLIHWMLGCGGKMLHAVMSYYIISTAEGWLSQVHLLVHQYNLMYFLELFHNLYW